MYFLPHSGYKNVYSMVLNPSPRLSTVIMYRNNLEGNDKTEISGDITFVLYNIIYYYDADNCKARH